MAEVEFDPVVRVDTFAPLNYPIWMCKVMHRELEASGPDKFDVGALETLSLPERVKGGVKGYAVYAQLEETGAIAACLSLRDLEEIQKKGVPFFRKYFPDKVVFGWKSVIERNRGSLSAPYLVETPRGVLLNWGSLNDRWTMRRPVLAHRRDNSR